MGLLFWYLVSFFVILVIVVGYYFLIEQKKSSKKLKSNIIHLQTDGFDFILYKGKINEFISNSQRYLADFDVIVYGKSLFIGLLEHKKSYIDLPAKIIQSVKYEPNKIIIECYKEIVGTEKIILKGSSTKHMYYLAKKIDFISRRSKKASAI